MHRQIALIFSRRKKVVSGLNFDLYIICITFELYAAHVCKKSELTDLIECENGSRLPT